MSDSSYVSPFYGFHLSYFCLITKLFTLLNLQAEETIIFNTNSGLSIIISRLSYRPLSSLPCKRICAQSGIAEPFYFVYLLFCLSFILSIFYFVYLLIVQSFIWSIFYLVNIIFGQSFIWSIFYLVNLLFGQSINCLKLLHMISSNLNLKKKLINHSFVPK